MSTTDDGSAADSGAGEGSSGSALDADAYDVLRGRLEASARELARRAEALNSRRQEVFGSSELRLTGSERLRTARASLPADVAPVGRLLLFAANPAEVTEVGDVFQLLPLETESSAAESSGAEASAAESGPPQSPAAQSPAPEPSASTSGAAGPSVAGPVTAAAPGLLDDPQFVRDFAELYRYYRETRLLRLRVLDGRLLAVFRTGPGAGDVRVLGWRVGRDGRCRYEGAARETADAGEGYAVQWTAAGRGDHVPGRRPHLALTAADGGALTVATTGGTLTLRTGETVYEEPVEDALQALADAEVAWATAGPLLLLRVRPYHEDADRHFAVNTRTGGIERIDALGRGCLRLPDEQGVIFPGGYALATGGTRTFDVEDPQPGGEPLEFERLVRSAGGEDVLYVFHAAADGRRLLLPYHLIRKEAAAPLYVQGCALYEDGTLLTLRPADGGEPARVHTAQRWRTPFLSDTYAAAQPVGEGPLDRIGNPDLVRAVADALSVARSALETAPALPVYEALVAACDRVLDRHHWLAEPDAGDLAGPLAEVRDTGRQVLAEYARVREQTRRAQESVEQAAADNAALVRLVRGEAAADAAEWVRRLTELRRAQGRLTSLREVRYADAGRLDALAAVLAEELTAAAGRAAELIARDDAFDDYRGEIEAVAAAAAGIGSAADAVPLAAALDEQAAGLRTVTETAGTLEIADATVRTRILAAAADVLGAVNQARAVLDARRADLLTAESQAEFDAESALLGQSVSGALAAADTPEACDEQLGRLLVQVEDLAARFAASEDRLAALAGRREEIQQTFAARKQALADERADRIRRLTGSAARILDGVRRRAAALSSPDDVNTYFAADPMPAQHRRIARELHTLGDPARAAELDAALAAVRQDTGRALRDRQDLYEDGGAVVRLGRHRFAVNTRPFELALVPHDGGLAFTVSGTDYLAPVADAGFAETRRFWERPLVSEAPGLYRAEYLAATLLLDTPPAALAAADLPALVRDAAAARLDEGYERGVHDHDAALLLAALTPLAATAALLRYPPATRATAHLFWTFAPADAPRPQWTTRARSLARAASAFGAAAPNGRPGAPASALTGLAEEIGGSVREFFAGGTGLREGFGGLGGLGGEADAGMVGEYLVAELGGEQPGFVEGPGAREVRKGFVGALGGTQAVAYKELVAELEALGPAAGARWQLARAWVEAFSAGGEGAGAGDGAGEGAGAGAGAGYGTGSRDDVVEAAAGLACGGQLVRYASDAAVGVTVEGLLGSHPRIAERRLAVRLDDLLTRVRRFRQDDVPAYRAYQRRRTAVLAAERDRLGLAAYRPRPLTGFVRNRLLDEVSLPLVGDSLAKQFGAPGGLLMLMSPPGYGKTSLMEYVAARLGLALVTVSGPALGAATTSLDPDRAPDAAARREVDKLNFALALGSNVLLHLDDIQHTSAELLQKFIPLCDAQRRIEGPAGPYDLRGKRFAVCMSGNPYTESGRLFRIPDMLANRADVWNLGDVLTGREALFAQSYVENALTANDVLAPLAGRDRADVELLVRLAEDDPTARADGLAHPYPADELAQILAVLRHLLRARATALTVNAAYIASAARTDTTRTEPPFLLQGSYRTMNKLAARILPTMNAAELDAAVTDHYRAEAQTLASGAEAALLKLAELRGRLTPEQAERWAAVKAAYTGSAAR